MHTIAYSLSKRVPRVRIENTARCKSMSDISINTSINRGQYQESIHRKMIVGYYVYKQGKTISNCYKIDRNWMQEMHRYKRSLDTEMPIYTGLWKAMVRCQQRYYILICFNPHYTENYLDIQKGFSTILFSDVCWWIQDFDHLLPMRSRIGQYHESSTTMRA